MKSKEEIIQEYDKIADIRKKELTDAISLLYGYIDEIARYVSGYTFNSFVDNIDNIHHYEFISDFVQLTNRIGDFRKRAYAKFIELNPEKL